MSQPRRESAASQPRSFYPEAPPEAPELYQGGGIWGVSPASARFVQSVERSSIGGSYRLQKMAYAKPCPPISPIYQFYGYIGNICIPLLSHPNCSTAQAPLLHIRRRRRLMRSIRRCSLVQSNWPSADPEGKPGKVSGFSNHHGYHENMTKLGARSWIWTSTQIPGVK